MEDLKDFFLKAGVYNKITENYDKFFSLSNSAYVKSLDLYCPKCMCNKTFVRQNVDKSSALGSFNYQKNGGYTYADAITLISYTCPTCGFHVLYAFYYDGNYIHKISQFPSLLDLSRDELKQFDKNSLIDKDNYAEIRKSYECASSGFYVAAYVYLRRVYENLFINLFKENEKDFSISLNDFIKLKFDNKLEMLKDKLAIEDSIYKPLYSLLSSGIHSLSENECQQHYHLLKNILLEILMEQKVQTERQNNHKTILDLYSKIQSKNKKG